MANKLLDTMYSDTPELRKGNSLGAGGGGAVGCGAGEASGHGTGLVDGSTSRFVGFGNTSSPQSQEKSPSTTEKILHMFSSSKSSSHSSPVYDPSYASMDPVPHNTRANAPFMPVVSSVPGPVRYSSNGGPKGDDYTPCQAGGGWGSERGGSCDHPSTAAQPDPVRQEAEEQGDSQLRVSLESSNMEQERRLVDDITAPGGVRPAPPRESLDIFISRCRSLDCLAVVECLKEKLQSQEHQVVLRALFVVEALQRSDVPDILPFLDLTLDELTLLSDSAPQSSVRSKATKILRVLSAEATHQPSSVTHQRSTGSESQAAQTGNILDLGGGGEEEGVASGELVPGVDETVEMSPLFDGMLVSGVKRTPAKPTLKTRQNVATVSPMTFDGRSPTRGQLSNGSPAGGRDDGMPPLVTFEEEEVMDEDQELDPLKLSASSEQHSGGRGGGGGGGASWQADGSAANPPLLGDLAGLDLTSTELKSATGPSLEDILLPLQSSSATSQPYSTAQPMLRLSQPPITATPSQFPGGVVSMPGSTVPVAYTVLPGGGVGGGPLGQQQGAMPVMYAPQMMYMGQIGGDDRPVQRPPPSSSRQQSEGSEFSFLSKSNKGAAFDFVKDEITQMKKK